METSPQQAQHVKNDLTHGVDTRAAVGTDIRYRIKPISMSTSPTLTTVADVSDATNPESAAIVDNLPGTPASFSSVETTIIELISTTATTSAFPESFGLSISTSGRWIIAYSSSALYVLSAQRLPEYKNSCRAFKLRRKPLAAAITDGGKLAILTTPHKIDIYQCGEGAGAPLTGGSQSLTAVYLDYEARTISFTAEGDVIAAGSDGGIELRNLSEGSLATDTRQITCGSLDTIAFSADGRSLLITAAARRARISTFVSVNGAYEDALFDDAAFDQLQPVGKMWITQLLFPERLQARQAVFLPDASTGQITELLAYNSEKEQYSLFDVTSKNFVDRSLGTPEDFRWSRSERFEDTQPALSADASHVAVAVKLKDSSEIWLYHVPRLWRDLDSAHDSANDSAEEQISVLTPDLRLRLPQREDNQPSERLICLRWLKSNVNIPARGRLFALVSSAGLSMPEDIVPSEAPAASGKLCVFDLIRSNSELPRATPKTVSIDLDSIPPIEHLAEETMGLEQEVDLVRRRTTRAQRGRDSSGMLSPRDPRAARRSLSSGSSSGGIVTLRDLAESNTTRPRRRRSFSSMSSMSEENLDMSPVAVDEPYAMAQPRSQFTLDRAATVAANSLAHRSHLRSLPNQPLEYRRADGLREIPHESDADDWVPPPPPYSERPDPPGPNAVSLPINAIPGVAATIRTETRPQHTRPQQTQSQQTQSQQAQSQQAQRQQAQRQQAQRQQSQPQQPQPQQPQLQQPQLQQPQLQQPQLQQALPTQNDSPRSPPSTQPSVAVPQMSQMPSIPPILPSSIAVIQTPPSPIIARRPVPPPQQQINSVSQQVRTTGLPVVTTLPSTSLTAQPQQPISPPGPGALHSPFTFPPARSSSHSNQNLLATSQQIPTSLSRSMPSSPVDLSRSNQRQGVATSDFQPMMQLPTPEQMETLHRRSSSGGSAPRAAMGAMGTNTRRLPSIELNRPLPSLPSGSHSAIRSSGDMSRRPPMRDGPDRQRPAFNRLATIASIVSRTSTEPLTDECPPVPPPVLPNSAPTTPTGRRGRWRVVSGRASQLGYQTENNHQSNPDANQAHASKGSSKKRGTKCIVM